MSTKKMVIVGAVVVGGYFAWQHFGPALKKSAAAPKKAAGKK